MSTNNNIDALLEQYLGLLDQYTELRNELNTLQSSVYHHISRANFSAERGIRYGQDFYDQRMQASTLLEITTASSPKFYKFSVINKQDSDEVQQDKNPPSGATPLQVDIEGLQIDETNAEEIKDKESPPPEEPTAEEGGKETKVKTVKTPLSWFGILSPGAQSLRSAQTASIPIISSIVPQMASLDYEMKELEIRIRRAKKFRAKAEAELAKQEKTVVKDVDMETTAGSD